MERTEYLMRCFLEEVSDPVMLLATGVAGGIKTAKLATRSRWVRNSGCLGRVEKLLFEELKEELLSSYLVLGVIKPVRELSEEFSLSIVCSRLEKPAKGPGLYGGLKDIFLSLVK